MIGASQQKRLLVLCTTTGYQTCAFIEAAQRLGLSITFGTDRCHVLDDPWQDGALPLRFEDPEASAQRICDFAASHPLDAIVSIGDRPTSTGARACHKLGLRGHPPEATDICRDKYRSRERQWFDSSRYPRGICAGVRTYSEAFAQPGGRCFA